jgi:hypothetical protein
MKFNPYKIWGAALLFVVLLSGCIVAAPDKYANTEKNIDLDAKDRRTFKIAANKAWQKPGVYLVKNAKVRISAKGKWSPWPEIGLECGPDGDESSSLTGEAPWIPFCALMARLGQTGRPFIVGSDIEFTAKEPGHLYFTINDPFNYLYNNTGTLVVSVTVEYPEGQ